MQLQPTTTQTQAMLRHFLDSNAIILWVACIALFSTAVVLPAVL